ncbi:MAG: Ig-like domain-containing protein, partial [Pseudomonadota bacterium]
NDIDIDGDALTASLAATQSTAVAGTAVVNADGTFTFDPTAGFTGTTGFDYVVSDPSGASATGRVTIGVTFDNTPPEAVDDAYSVAEDGSLSVAAGLGVLANDSDVDGDALTAVLGTDVTDGTLTLNADGSFDYTPDADFNGSDSFTYTVSDGQGGTSTPATVTITVNPVNDPPQAVADSYTTGRDTQLAVTLAASGLLA